MGKAEIEALAAAARAADEADVLRHLQNRMLQGAGIDSLTGHGYQYFAGGNLRLDLSGMQLRSGGIEEPVIWMVEDFFSGSAPDNIRGGFLIGEVSGASLAQVHIGVSADLGSFQDGDESAFITLERVAGQGIIYFYVSEGGAAGQGGFQLVSRSATQAEITIDTSTALKLPNRSSDYADMTDGYIFYNPTTDKGKLRANGVTESIATESYVDANAAPAATVDYLVGTTTSELGAEIVVGTAPGGELGGTWAAPTVDTTHSGSAHHTREHQMNGTSDHTATAWRVFYSDSAGDVTELALGASGTVLKSNGASSAPSFGTVSGGMSLLVKEADETVNNSTTLQDDNEILFAVAANEVFQFEGVLFIQTTAAADFKMTFTGPSGAVGAFSFIYTDTVGAQDSGMDVLGGSESLTVAAPNGSLRFWGGIHNGANAGNLTLQWAQNTLEATDTKVLAGSYIKWQIET